MLSFTNLKQDLQYLLHAINFTNVSALKSLSASPCGEADKKPWPVEMNPPSFSPSLHHQQQRPRRRDEFVEKKNGNKK